VLQFNSETGKTTFSWSDVDQIGNTDTFSLTCTSILSILNSEMRTAVESVEIAFVDGSDVSGLIILADGQVLEGSRNGSEEDGSSGANIGGNPEYGNQDCSQDRIWLLTDFTIVDYYISARSGDVTLEPTFLQHLKGCPIACTLDESMSGGIIQSDIFSLDSESGAVSIVTRDEERAGDVQMKLTCTSTESTQEPFHVTSDDFMISMQRAGQSCNTDILDFKTAIPSSIDYTVSSPAQILKLDPGLTQEKMGCPVTCALGEVPSRTEYDSSVAFFDWVTGSVTISTSSGFYEYKKMDFIITCTSDESIHMEALRTVTETFTVHFVSPDAADCATDPTAFVMLSWGPTYEQVYVIDGLSTELSIKPQFFELSQNCPTICTLYEGLATDGLDAGLPKASDPSFRSWNQFTGELVVATDKISYAGSKQELTLVCVASPQFGGFFSVPFELIFTIPNGCFANIDATASTIED